MAEGRPWLARVSAVSAAVALLAVLCIVIWWPPSPTVVLVIRHAERDDAASCSPATVYSRPNPPISAASGEPRAQTLAHVGGEDSIVAIYASEFCRTQQTVQPLATQLGLPVTVVNQFAADGSVHVEDVVSSINSHKGQVVLVAGHTDTVPVIIEQLGGGTIDPINNNHFDNFYVVTKPRFFGRTKVVRLKYGEPPP